jgi:hypothetical protein
MCLRIILFKKPSKIELFFFFSYLAINSNQIKGSGEPLLTPYGEFSFAISVNLEISICVK